MVRGALHPEATCLRRIWIVLDCDRTDFIRSGLEYWHELDARGWGRRPDCVTRCHFRRERRYSHWARYSVSADEPLRPLCGARNFNHLCDHWHNPGTSALERSARAHAENLACDGPEFSGAGYSRGAMTAYLALKYLHVIGASVLLGTRAGIAFFMLLAHLNREPTIVAC